MRRRATMEDAYPLHWPEGQKRTAVNLRGAANFKVPLATARDRLLDELKRLGARYAVLSTNVPLRRDGLFYADARAPEPSDPGVAVYFDLDAGRTGEFVQHAMACDRWRSVRDNVHALGKTIEAMRGIERWGSSEIMLRAFSAFAALPPAPTDWRSILGFHGHGPGLTLDDVRQRFRTLASQAHPDAGGSHDDMVRLNQAMTAAEQELGQEARA